MRTIVNPKNILVLCPTGLGNIILFLPAFHALKKAFPRPQFTIALDGRWFGDEFFLEQFGKKSIFTKFPSNQEGRICQLKAILKLRRSKFDLVLMPYSAPSWKLAILLLSVRSRKRIFFETKVKCLNRRFSVCLSTNEGEHYIDKNFRQVRSLGVDIDMPDKWIFAQSRGMISYLDKNKYVDIGIHPGGDTEVNWARAWPLKHYKELVDILLKERSRRITIYGGPGEEGIAKQLYMVDQSRCNLMINKSLKEISESIATLDVFVGNDSGLMNMAVGVGIPTLGILGPTNLCHTGPYGPKNRTVRLDIPCSPCYDSGRSLKCKHRRCLYELSPETVAGEIQELTSDA